MVQNIENQASDTQTDNTENILKFDASGQEEINIPSGKFISDSEISRNGQDLVLETNDGDQLIVQNYFSSLNAPVIQSPDGSILTENLVNSFLKNSDQYAQNETLNDESPIGAVEELEGTVTIIHANGSSESATLGTPIYEGDVIETSGNGAVNVLFLDETSMAVSENARMSVDNYKFDAATESGETNLSVLRGVFVYTSGLIGRDDPDDVLIETPVGSIGIRGTIIAGNINPQGKSEITVLEGAIVVSNGAGEVTLSQQFETVQISGFKDAIESFGVKEAGEMNATYGSVKNVTPKLFNSINDTAREQDNKNTSEEPSTFDESDEKEIIDVKPEEQNVDEGKVEILKPLSEIKRDALPKENLSPKLQNKEILNQDTKEHIDVLKTEVIEKDFFYNRFNPLLNKQDAPSPFSNVDASGAVISAAVSEPQLNYNGNNTLDKVILNPNTLLNKGHFEVVDGNGTKLIDVDGITGQKLGSTYDFIGDTDNDGELEFIVSSENFGAGKFAVYETLSGSTVTAPTTSATGSSNDKVGFSVAGIGDFDGDGKSDYAVGSPGVSGGQGHVEVNASNSAFAISSPSASTVKFGAYVDGIGDVNGDGYSDLIVGTENPDGGNYKAYIYHGNNASDNNVDTIIESANKFVAGGGIGDINGDGFDDFALSINNGTDVTTYAIYGSSSTPSTLTLAELNDPNIALKITHSINLGNKDYTINAIGDKNGDGFDDFQVGVVGGQKFVVHGDFGGDPATQYGADGTANDGSGSQTQADGVLSPTNSSVKALVGDVDFRDNSQTGLSMKGGSSNNTFEITNNSFMNIDGGKGLDTIKFDVGFGDLDFTNVKFEQISQIERIEIGNTDTVILTEANIFNLLKSSDNNKLMIDGATGSSLTIDSDNAAGTAATDIATALGGVYMGTNTDGFDHIKIGSYNLYVDTDISVDVV